MTHGGASFGVPSFGGMQSDYVNASERTFDQLRFKSASSASAAFAKPSSTEPRAVLPGSALLPKIAVGAEVGRGAAFDEIGIVVPERI